MRKKLRSQQGIAMLFAITGFAVVMVIGITFLTAGYARYSKSFGRKNDRQTYYTLVSAAKYAGSQLDGATIKVTEYFDDDGEDKAEKKVEPGPAPEFAGQNEWSKALVGEIFEKRSTDKSKVNASYELSFSNGSDFYETIKVEITGFDLSEVEITGFDLSKESFKMTLSTDDGKNSVQMDFTVSPVCAESTSFIDKYLDSERKMVGQDEISDTNRRIKDTTYTIRMGDIRTVNGSVS